jgi:ubiquinone/menaquinone biosynthesis C-methylase UbiE
MIATAHLDFGYPWWLTYGHLPLVAGSGALLALGFWRKWPLWTILLLSPLFLWSSTAFLAARFVLNINGEAALPTQSFFRSGVGRILDLGAGTGRSSIMVLKARPQAALVALDLFGESFEQHFGPSRSPQQKLLANLQAAGVERRVTIVTADMRKLPFEPSTFDAIVSAYVFEHLNREGIQQALAETARVVKPGGDFLLMLIGKEPWFQYTFGPVMIHQGYRGADWWTPRLQEAGFQVLEKGTCPATLYLLARRSPSPVATIH